MCVYWRHAIDIASRQSVCFCCYTLYTYRSWSSPNCLEMHLSGTASFQKVCRLLLLSSVHIHAHVNLACASMHMHVLAAGCKVKSSPLCTLWQWNSRVTWTCRCHRIMIWCKDSASAVLNTQSSSSTADIRYRVIWDNADNIDCGSFEMPTCKSPLP